MLKTFYIRLNECHLPLEGHSILQEKVENWIHEKSHGIILYVSVAPPSWDQLLSLLDALYICVSQTCFRLDNPLFSVDVVLEFMCGYPFPETFDATWIHPEIHPETSQHRFPDSKSMNTFDITAVGGTFDHLHAGHKILLTMAAFMTETKLICGVLDAPDRLCKKHFGHLIQPIQDRIHHVELFLKRIKSSIEYQVIPIIDDFGPTLDDSSIKALVGSLETKKGCEKVNQERLKNNLMPLELFFIDVISSQAISNEEWSFKISSSSIREWIHQNQK